MHPACDPAAVGRATHLDFRILAGVVSRLGGGGVYLNVGSAVLLPEVFLKAVTLARNLGHELADFATVNMDFIQSYRPNTNVVQRPDRAASAGATASPATTRSWCRCSPRRSSRALPPARRLRAPALRDHALPGLAQDPLLDASRSAALGARHAARAAYKARGAREPVRRPPAASRLARRSAARGTTRRQRRRCGASLAMHPRAAQRIVISAGRCSVAGRPDEAAASFEAACASIPPTATRWPDGRGPVSCDRYAEAAREPRRAIATEPPSAARLNSLGTATGAPVTGEFRFPRRRRPPDGARGGGARQRPVRRGAGGRPSGTSPRSFSRPSMRQALADRRTPARRRAQRRSPDDRRRAVGTFVVGWWRPSSSAARLASVRPTTGSA